MLLLKPVEVVKMTREESCGPLGRWNVSSIVHPWELAKCLRGVSMILDGEDGYP